ncbi:MAG: DUF1697 domain-containing protein [Marmoricola sp.]
MSSSVAFFRNLNLGQRRSRSPTRPQLLDAFAGAGATAAVSFQTNGTVIFESGRRSAQRVANEAVALLTPVCGYDDMVIARPVDWLRALDLDDVPDHAEVSFFDGPDPFPEALPWRPDRGGVTVIRADHRHAVTVDDRERSSGATWVLEARLGVPVTSRGVPTMRRLLLKLAAQD